MTKLTGIRGKHRRLLQWCFAMVTVSLAACQTPAPTMPVQAPPKPQLSYLNIPISMPLALAATTADKDVPRAAGVDSFQHRIEGGAQAPECGIDAGYSITRGPLAMSASGNAIRTTFELSYWLQGRKQIPCPGTFTTASCGMDGEPPRTAKLSIDTKIDVLPDLATNVHSTLGPLVPVDRCVLNPTGLDVTDGLMAAFDGALKPMLENLDKRLAAELQLRQRVETGWARMSGPTEDMKQGLESALNRRRGNVQLHGKIEDLNLVGVYRVPNGGVFTAYLAAGGKIWAEVDAQ